MKHYSDVIARLGREAWLFALRGRYFIARENRSGNLPRRTEQTILLPAEWNRAEALSVFYAQALHWGIAHPHTKNMGHNRYQVFPACGAQFFLVEIIPGDCPKYRIEDLSADLRPLQTLKSWLEKQKAALQAEPDGHTIAPVPLMRGMSCFHQADSGRRFAIRINDNFDDFHRTKTPYVADMVLLPEGGDPASLFWQQAVEWGIAWSLKPQDDDFDDDVPF
jgi:hypothetical protein